MFFYPLIGYISNKNMSSFLLLNICLTSASLMRSPQKSLRLLIVRLVVGSAVNVQLNKFMSYELRLDFLFVIVDRVIAPTTNCHAYPSLDLNVS